MKINEIYSIKEDIENITINDIEKVFLGTMKDSEPDTSTESEIFHRLSLFVNDATQLRKQDVYEILQQLQKLKHKYPEDLVPNASIAYRGTTMNKNKYMKIVKDILETYPELRLLKDRSRQSEVIAKFIHLPEDSPGRFYEKPFVYKPRSIVQSWTTDFFTASLFAGNQGLTNKLVIMTKIDDSFIMNPMFMNVLSREVGEAHEYETIRISDQSIKAKLIIDINWIINKILHSNDYDELF